MCAYTIFHFPFRCFAWDDSVVVAGTDAGNVVIVQLYPSPKIINMFAGSSGMWLTVSFGQVQRPVNYLIH